MRELWGIQVFQEFLNAKSLLCMRSLRGLVSNKGINDSDFLTLMATTRGWPALSSQEQELKWYLFA